MNIESAIRRSHELIQSRLSKISNFDEFNNDVEGFNIFFYNEDHQLVFWSDYGYVPQLEAFENGDSLGIIANNSGIFLFDQYQSAQGTIIGLIPIKLNYSYSNQYLDEAYNHDLIPGNVEITDHPNSVPIFDDGKRLFSIRCLIASENSFRSRVASPWLVG